VYASSKFKLEKSSLCTTAKRVTNRKYDT